ncbi:DUF4418 family protein [Tissierella praeacuta]|uniref:DUF4418 family protein n=1 Tax=Tissierella praeacuta TaxID=43131 RepID=UPI001C0F70DB|nr:DUF4418 family protein [Tissierella praeacuta]MBU5257096.1 DUF4418 family protein [Tissierella praeacuta]
MKLRVLRLLNLILIFTGLIIIGSILIWAPVCENLLELANGNMVHMKCYYTGQASILLSIILIVSGIESLLTKSSHPWTFIAIGIMVTIITFTSKLGIGICMKETMSCHDTAIWIRGGGIITVTCGLISLFIGTRKIQN